jgi:hypothetical protein
MFSTRNLYGLPVFYNYGVGSAGLGTFRELVTQIKATNWVLAGEIDTFPLMYHYRVMPVEGERGEIDLESHAGYVSYWDGNEAVGRYMLDRRNASYELVMFLEHMSHTVADWLPKNQAKVTLVIAHMGRAIAFLRKEGIIHFDAHLSNMVTDGKRVYLTDFGLALDRQFELAPEERKFHKDNSHYDYALLLWSLGFGMLWIYRGMGDDEKKGIAERYGLDERTEPAVLLAGLMDNLDEIVSSGLMKLDRSYLAAMRRYRPIILLMNSFLRAMRKSSAKDARFENAQVKRTLRAAGLQV